MNEALRLLKAYGLRLRFADLGDWGDSELRAEYDPEAAEIRIHRCLAPALVPRAILHEIYHHREAIGEIARLHDREARETAADDYASLLLESSG